MYPLNVKGFTPVSYLRNLELETPNKTYKLISDYNKNFKINSTVNEIKKTYLMSIPENMKVLQPPHGIPKKCKSLICSCKQAMCHKTCK